MEEVAMRYWKLRDPGEAPYALMGTSEDDLRPRRFVPGEGWVDWPSLAMYIYRGEPFADRIDEAEARRLMAQGLGKIDKKYVDSARGPTPTIKE